MAATPVAASAEPELTDVPWARRHAAVRPNPEGRP
jgi:hypothetical protein